MELFEQIRKSHEREALSIRALAERFGTHRRMVRQALENAQPPPRKALPPKEAPALGPYKAIIDGWLADDEEAPRKQRHTARRIWERLVEEHGADVGESTVRRYVASRKAGTPLALPEEMVPQNHPLGSEAEGRASSPAIRAAPARGPRPWTSITTSRSSR